MAFIELSDNLLSIDVVVFPSTYKKHREVIHSNKVCIVALKKDYQNDKWILENIRLV